MLAVGNAARCCPLGGARRFGAHGEERGGAYRGGRPPTACSARYDELTNKRNENGQAQESGMSGRAGLLVDDLFTVFNVNHADDISRHRLAT